MFSSLSGLASASFTLTVPPPLDKVTSLRAGLALAGANARSGGGSEDGILTAEEVASLDLRGVELVVLSACDTAAGDISAGEGVLGLRSAFRQAGARSIVMTLWSIGDNQARLWMQDFYREYLVEDATPGNAATQASRDSLERLREEGLPTHPFQWANFVAMSPDLR